MKYQDDMRIIEIKEALNVGESVVKKFLKSAKQKVVNLYKSCKHKDFF